MSRFLVLQVLLGLFSTSVVFGQLREKPIRIFGYFQNTFQYEHETNEDVTGTTFNLQQLNLFFQSDISTKWRAFINFEFLNNFASSRQHGSANLEEAWIRYRANEKFNLKLGLLLPIFNNLNDIKNRTPILPYIIRPIVYETSFNEFIPVEEFTPQKAFVQIYGFLPFGENKFDYAVFLGNSPNLSTAIPGIDSQSGVDTTDTFLVGGRAGLRMGEVKTGVSYTLENDDQFQTGEFVPVGSGSVSEVPRTRLGADLSFQLGRLSLESEYITFKLDNQSELDLEQNFYYATLGYEVNERWFAYLSYWYTRSVFQVNDVDVKELTIRVPTAGVAFYLNNRITFKAQYAFADVDYFEQDIMTLQGSFFRQESGLHFIALGASAIF